MSERCSSFEKIEELFTLDDEIKLKIKILYVFSDGFKARNNVILVTNEDKVYCIGSNAYGALGFGHQNPVEEFTINKELCNKQIIDFKNSLWHTFARNSDRKLYCWGNELCSLNGRRDNNINKPKLIKFSANQKIIDYCCGGGHILVLTSNKVVYAWGDNIKGQIGNRNIGDVVSIPYKVNKFSGERVKAISCGWNHSMALTESGRVYSWGDNSCGQLGIDCGGNEQNEPKQIQIEFTIEKVSCGYEHSLLLSSDGNIYALGWNNYRAVALINHGENSIKLNHSEKIAYHYGNDTSFALTQNGFHYVWSKCGKEGIISEPKETNLECFKDTFAELHGITVESLQYSSHIGNTFIPNGKYNKNWKEIKKLGKGSYGEVFKVENKLIENTIFAMKKTPIEEGNNSMKELVNSSLVLTFNSDHLVRYYDVWYENNSTLMNGFRDYTENYTIYIQMDLCDKTLKEINDEIKEYPKLYSNDSLTCLGYYILSRIFAEILDGVKYLHNKSIIHRDLNPYNILVKMQTNGNYIKIADFNLAVVHEINKLHTKDRGHVNYVAPEQLKSRKYDTRADIFSLGVILEELFYIKFERSTNDSAYMRSKYECLERLIESMTSRIPQNRPNCDKILGEKHDWAINEKEFNFEEELNFHQRINKENRSYVQNLIVSILSHII